MSTNKAEQTVRADKPFWSRWIYFAAGLAAIWGGRVVSSDLLILAGCAMLVWAFFLLVKSDRTPCADCSKKRGKEAPCETADNEASPHPRPTAACDRAKDDAVDQRDALVQQMLDQSRYALLLRPQIAAGLKPKQFAQVAQALDEGMALVPDGEVTLGRSPEASDEIPISVVASAQSPGHTVKVQRFFLDRYPVTNRQYYEFVAAGGYERMSLWDESVLPALLDFVDRTGHAGPRYWKNGCYLEGQENRPIVGVCWYEALAYAGWVGKRLPTEAEWVKAGCWPVAISKSGRFQRRYPWGEMIDRKRANLWGSGPETLVDVDEFEEGVSVGGVYQLIGNVWEWNFDDFQPERILPENTTLEEPLKGIHGGAFDTYFDNQATCQFQSGENVLSRRHNIGFRLAISVCDLALGQAPAADPTTRSSRCENADGDKSLTAGDILSPCEDVAEEVGAEEVPV